MGVWRIIFGGRKLIARLRGKKAETPAAIAMATPKEPEKIIARPLHRHAHTGTYSPDAVERLKLAAEGASIEKK